MMDSAMELLVVVSDFVLIMPRPLFVAFSCVNQDITFVVSIEGLFLQPRHSMFINTQIKLAMQANEVLIVRVL